MRTEIAVSKYGSELTRGDGYWVVRTPDNPTYWHGNCLIFDAPPRAGDFERWMSAFAREHAGLQSEHRVFAIDAGDGDAGDSAPFVAAGFTVERSHVLSASRVVPPRKLNHDVAVRPLRGDGDWNAAFALSLDVALNEMGHTDAERHAEFLRRRLAVYRRMQELGMGHTWGAFLGSRLVGKLGLFHAGELSRFQAVETDRAHRRLGVCGTLVHRVCEHALSERPGRRLVMYALQSYHATLIYQSLGFAIVEHIVDFERPPPGALRGRSTGSADL